MLATFLKGLVTGAARGAARNINKENERMRESFDTASKMFLDQVTKERQLRSLKRTEIMGKMNRIEALDENNILTPAELYILAGNDANFTKDIMVMKATVRMGFPIYRATAFCTITNF